MASLYLQVGSCDVAEQRVWHLAIGLFNPNWRTIMSRIKWGAGLILVLALAVDARAGGPPPVCMVIDKLVFEPNEQAPTRVQIWGTFSFLKEKTDYGKPVQGYLYYALADGKEKQCRKEWAQLKKLVADKHIVAFGLCGSPKVDGHLRKPTEKLHSPVVFPLSEQGFTDGDRWAHDYPSLKKLETLMAGKRLRVKETN
jgi:hypothetical protein